MTNHLAGEASPYLLQHSENPVDWYPWGSQALEKARVEDKPIFLSIGYSACHWCHVMEHESFSDEKTASLLNQHFVCIKVDREERPDLDAIYMDAVSALTGSGGWPLSVWLTPTGAPFFGGTYFPDSPRYGTPSFQQVILVVADAWGNRRQEIERSASTVTRSLARETGRSLTGEVSTGDEAVRNLAASFDRVCGGWGQAPKFPHPMILEYLMMRLQADQEPDPVYELEHQVERTLEAMAYGGMFDQLRGGFHRYSTDTSWLVPHFEKMLYDNAQLARCYLHAWQLFGGDLYRDVCQETLEYLIAEMKHPEGGFFSSQDADSEGEEGKFFVWTLEEVRRTLTPEEAELVVETFGMTAGGNFEGKNTLHVVEPPNNAVPQEMLATAKSRLLEARDRRIRPGRDEKILASWNGLALAAFAEAGRALGSQRYLDVALGLAGFVTRKLITPDHRVVHSWKDGRCGTAGFLEDYACLAEGFLALYQATFDEQWFGYSRKLADVIMSEFARADGGFFDTSMSHEQLITRPRSLQDSPTPSGNAMAATVLFKLAAYTGEARYQDAAEGILRNGAPPAAAAPTVFGQWLCANSMLITGLTEVAIVGEPAGDRIGNLTSAVSKHYLPFVVAAGTRPGASSQIAIINGREPPAGAEAVAWVCRRQACSAAITNETQLEELLRANGGSRLRR